MKTTIALTAVLLLQGCASIINGSTQDVQVESAVAGEKFTVTAAGKQVASGVTPAVVYVLCSDDGALMKIGISNNPDHRIACLRRVTPFSFSWKAAFNMIGRKAREIESEAHQSFSSAELSGFDGATEWFRYDPDIFSFIEKRAL